jgi:hypothetical protein
VREHDPVQRPDMHDVDLGFEEQPLWRLQAPQIGNIQGQESDQLAGFAEVSDRVFGRVIDHEDRAHGADLGAVACEPSGNLRTGREVNERRRREPVVLGSGDQGVIGLQVGEEFGRALCKSVKFREFIGRPLPFHLVQTGEA